MNTWVSFQSAEQPLLGQFSVSGNTTRRNLVVRLQEAWASALRLSVDEVDGLVHITDNATYRIYRDPEDKVDELPALFERASYLCKAATKSYGDRQRGFDTSKG